MLTLLSFTETWSGHFTLFSATACSVHQCYAVLKENNNMRSASVTNLATAEIMIECIYTPTMNHKVAGCH